MRIVYVSNEYPPQTGLGGIATYTYYAAHAMAARGHEVHVICRSEQGNHWVQNGPVTLHYTGPGEYPLPQNRFFYILRMLCYRFLSHSLQRLAWARSAHQTLMSIIKQSGRVDIVEYPECGAEGFYIAAKYTGTTTVRLHTPWTFVRKIDKIKERLPDTLLLAFLEKKAVRQASACNAPSQAIVKIIPRHWLTAPPVIIPNPIQTDDFCQTTGRDWIYTGRVEYRKGVHLLINAYAQLCRKSLPPILRLVGRPYGIMPSGEFYEHYIETLISQHSLCERIEWIKGTDQNGIKAFLAQSGVAIFPSLWENYPYSCLEAMASGLAVIASTTGGFPEIIIPKENGLLFKSENPQTLADALTQCLDITTIARLGRAARSWVTVHCSSAILAPKIEAFYNSVVKQGRS